MTFSQKILTWYHINKRDLPWRKTRDPYKIWLSEIMLQQTRVAQGMPYYHRFVEAFPKVGDLANASEEQVLKLWQGLGYYSRARNLHATAKMVANDYQGEFPNTYKGLKSLKGVGDYTASAIASFCFDLPEPVVDGNVYRVLSRYFDVDLPINSTEGIKYFKELAREVMDSENIRDYNQGIMEFGAIQCAPKNPDCESCPLNESCLALQQNKVAQLPVKLNKTKIRNRYFNYIVLLDDDQNTILEQRKGKGIWQNLYQFPLIESEKTIQLNDLEEALIEKSELPKTESLSLYNKEPIVHKLSHQHLHTQFWVAKTSQQIENGIPWGKIDTFPVPVLVADFIKTLKI
ncbi:A/G-specific adenine glycosylase [Flagellimonas zhangzhouensis]|uniref:Adenine DNA glycosylase n=1 Tax=Flagellimonas zhangzhouensis TaxID=1073328 RepID=A0A1H2VCP9_9FLAO|nr:A/G-specific adenine glycosylase [Allomuricauda zhangzhouensis]SDQ09183.1 A/G-specific DNA-adenine glycosylase [Allomuricauda zhangzhouensis]SDW65659.1 A/G-specific DNA-adenine glycosylase [Allomuricauda zhangzhouensis]